MRRLAVFRRYITIPSVTRNSDAASPLVQFLKTRGLVSNVTSPELETLLAKTKTTLYLGADPTASSLHLGNMIPLMVLLYFYIRGHHAIALVGGATGEVGDPSGRATERQHMITEERERNVKSIHDQMAQFLERGFEYAQKRGYDSTMAGKVTRANNADWWKDVTMLHFLGTYGRHIRVAQMLARESVKARLESEQGIGFNEFTYQVLQAYDFWHLFKTHGCRVQLGGNDQWGNITAGIDLISRLRSSLKSDKQTKSLATKDAYGLTVPLLTTPSGEKFGKSAGNAVWLDPTLTKPFELYQYFIKSPDSVVASYLSLFTLLPSETIDEIVAKHTQDESARYAQRVLAQEVTDLVHGEGSGERAEFISNVLFSEDFSSASPDAAPRIIEVFSAEGMLKSMDRSQVIGEQWRNVLANVLGKSKAECSRLVKAGGVYAGLDRRQVVSELVDESHIDGGGDLLLIRTGKSNYTAVKLV